MKTKAPNHEPILSAELAGRVGEVLRTYWGFDTLRPLQEQAIAAAIAGRDSLLVMPTGGGKSLCYQVPALLDGSLDIVVSPLISLMKDQVDGLAEAGVPAVALYSGLTSEQRRDAFARLGNGEIRLLFTSPERLVTDGFLNLLKGQQVRRFAIDEAHCISQWGHDFRPEYRQLASLREMFPKASLHAFTATATPQVRDDIVQQLALRDAEVLVGAVDRANLTYRVVPKVDVERQTAEVLARHSDEAVIVYCISRKETESLAAWLSGKGFPAQAYHAGMDAGERHRVQDAFANEKLNVVIATVAFGMGIDRSNVRCVIHTGMPKSIEHYQQETGRAGRDGLEAECVLLYSAGDMMKWERIITNSAAEAPNPEVWLDASMKLLQGMSRFAGSALCRHRALSQYFGQQYAQASCGACDVCLNEVDSMPDATTLAQKVISCVARAQQRFGIGQIVDILLGAETESIRRFGHNKLSTYGILKEMDKKSLTAVAYQLVEQGLLARSDGEYPVLQLNAASVEVMKGERQVTLIQPAKKTRKRSPRGEADLSGVDAGLFEHLRRWRRESAAAHGVPPYVIFPDTTLISLARLRPTSLSRLGLVPGIGQKKRDDYGRSLCEIVAQYCQEHNIEVDVQSALQPRRPPKPKTPALDLAFDLFRKGRSIQEVAGHLDRATSTVCEYLEHFIHEDQPADISAWVDAATLQRVRDAIGDEPITALKPIYERLTGEVPYGQIRIVLAHLRR